MTAFSIKHINDKCFYTIVFDEQQCHINLKFIQYIIGDITIKDVRKLSDKFSSYLFGNKLFFPLANGRGKIISKSVKNKFHIIDLNAEELVVSHNNLCAYTSELLSNIDTKLSRHLCKLPCAVNIISGTGKLIIYSQSVIREIILNNSRFISTHPVIAYSPKLNVSYDKIESNHPYFYIYRGSGKLIYSFNLD